MKPKSILSLAVAVSMTVTAQAQTTSLWSDNDGKTIGWDGSNTILVGVDIPQTVQRGDELIVTLTTSNQYYNKLQLCKANNYWAGDALVEIENNAFSGGTTTITITSDIIAALAAGTPTNYLYFNGYNCTLTDVSLKSNYGTQTLYSNGEGKTQNWWGDLLASSLFGAAKAGDMLTVTVSAITGESAGIIISNKQNNSAEGYEIYSQTWITEPATVNVLLTSAMITAAQSDGLYVYGGNYTYTAVGLVYAPTVTVNATAGYASFSYPAALDLTDVDAYAVTVDGSTATLTSIKGKKIAAGTGILLKGSGDVEIALTTEDTETVTNSLSATSAATVNGDGSTIYVLANGNNGVGFYKLKSGETVDRNKAYLTISAGAREFIGFFDGGTTAINEELRTKSPATATVYDIQGRRISQPTKGLYIVNGKKLIIK